MKLHLAPFTLLLLLNAFTSTAQKNIVNRWLVAGKLSQGEAFPIGNPQEYEFLKDNKYKIYDEGVVSVNGNYEMAADGNSFFLKNAGTTLKVKIVRLNAIEMNIVYDMGQKVADTMVYYVSGTPMANQAKKKFLYDEDYFKNLLAAQDLYITRGELITTISAIIKSKTKENDSLVNAIRQQLIKADKLVSRGAYVAKMLVIQYFYIQENLTSGINLLLQMADAAPAIKNSKDYLEAKKKLTDNQKDIDKAKIKFNTSFKLYYSG